MRASLTDIFARKIAPRVRQVGEDPRACSAREQGSRRTRRHPRDDPRAEVGEDGVGVDVRVGAVECQLNVAARSIAGELDVVKYYKRIQ